MAERGQCSSFKAQAGRSLPLETLINNTQFANMVRITARIPVTMSAVRRNGTTVSFEQNPRNGNNFLVAITAHNSATIQDLENRIQGQDYDAMDVPVRDAIRNMIRASPTRLDQNGNEEYYLEDHDAYDDPNDPGGGGSVSYGVPTHLADT